MFGPLFSCFLYLRLHPSIHFVPFISLAFEHLFLCYNLANYIIFFFCVRARRGLYYSHSFALCRSFRSTTYVPHFLHTFQILTTLTIQYYMYRDAIIPYTPLYYTHLHSIHPFFPFPSHFHQFHRSSCAHSSTSTCNVFYIFTIMFVFLLFLSFCFFLFSNQNFVAFCAGDRKKQIYYIDEKPAAMQHANGSITTDEDIKSNSRHSQLPMKSKHILLIFILVSVIKYVYR